MPTNQSSLMFVSTTEKKVRQIATFVIDNKLTWEKWPRINEKQWAWLSNCSTASWYIGNVSLTVKSAGEKSGTEKSFEELNWDLSLWTHFFDFNVKLAFWFFLKLSLRWTTCWWSNKTNLRSLKLKFHFSIGKIKIDFQKLIIQLCWILESTFYFLFLLK